MLAVCLLGRMRVPRHSPIWNSKRAGRVWLGANGWKALDLGGNKQRSLFHPSFLFSEVQTRGKQEVEDFVPPVVALRRLCLLASGFG